MISYQEVLDNILRALSQRAPGSQVQVEDHERAEISLLDYIEQVRVQFAGSAVRTAYGKATADSTCVLYWSIPFEDMNYSWVISAFDEKGWQVPVLLVESSTTAIVVQTSVNATVNALALPYTARYEEEEVSGDDTVAPDGTEII